jgi:hypothetical protein
MANASPHEFLYSVAMQPLTPQDTITRMDAALEHLHQALGYDGFLAVVTPVDADGDGGITAGTKIGLDFWKGLRGGGLAGLKSLKLRCKASREVMGGIPERLGGNTSVSASTTASRKSLDIKQELNSAMRNALREAAGDPLAEMRWTKPEQLEGYGVRIIGWPPEIALRNPSNNPVRSVCSRAIRACFNMPCYTATIKHYYRFSSQDSSASSGKIPRNGSKRIRALLYALPPKLRLRLKPKFRRNPSNNTFHLLSSYRLNLLFPAILQPDLFTRTHTHSTPRTINSPRLFNISPLAPYPHTNLRHPHSNPNRNSNPKRDNTKAYRSTSNNYNIHRSRMSTKFPDRVKPGYRSLVYTARHFRHPLTWLLKTRTRARRARTRVEPQLPPIRFPLLVGTRLPTPQEPETLLFLPLRRQAGSEEVTLGEAPSIARRSGVELVQLLKQHLDNSDICLPWLCS